MGLVAFSLMLVVAAFESRDEIGSVFRLETFDNRTVNITAAVEVALAVLIARGDFLTSLLGTVKLTGDQWLVGAAPALVLLLAWELGKALARGRTHPVEPVPVAQ
jgi:Ca2+-transporting ATPase